MVIFLFRPFVFSLSIYRCTTAISLDGRLTTNAFMAEYNQDRFELEIQAKEVQPPERTAKAKVYVSTTNHFVIATIFFCYDQSSRINLRDSKFKFHKIVKINV